MSEGRIYFAAVAGRIDILPEYALCYFASAVLPHKGQESMLLDAIFMTFFALPSNITGFFLLAPSSVRYRHACLIFLFHPAWKEIVLPCTGHAILRIKNRKTCQSTRIKERGKRDGGSAHIRNHCRRLSFASVPAATKIARHNTAVLCKRWLGLFCARGIHRKSGIGEREEGSTLKCLPNRARGWEAFLNINLADRTRILSPPDTFFGIVGAADAKRRA